YTKGTCAGNTAYMGISCGSPEHRSCGLRRVGRRGVGRAAKRTRHVRCAYLARSEAAPLRAEAQRLGAACAADVRHASVPARVHVPAAGTAEARADGVARPAVGSYRGAG